MVTQLVEAIEKAVPSFINLTSVSAREQPLEFTANELVIIACPVYSELPPKLFVDYLQSLHAYSTPTVLLSVYGNRTAGGCNRYLAELMMPRGFRIIAAANLIAEHSFSTPEYPIGAERPDQTDQVQIQNFARTVTALFKDPNRQLDLNHLAPATKPCTAILFQPPRITELCVHCGHCLSACPTNRILEGHQICIGCLACVKVCRRGARVVSPEVAHFQQVLSVTCKERQAPAFFTHKVTT